MPARRLAAEINAELAELDVQVEELANAPKRDDTCSLRARRSILHDFYDAVLEEACFDRSRAKGEPTVSEYQYYEFQAVDRPLGEADRQALQALSSRARVTARSFTNHYNYSDFRGDPLDLMKRWFDLHLYLTNWGTRRLMIRVPGRFLDIARFEVFLRKVEWVEIRESGESVIIDIHDQRGA